MPFGISTLSQCEMLLRMLSVSLVCSSLNALFFVTEGQVGCHLCSVRSYR
jgi:hypothetical protein